MTPSYLISILKENLQIGEETTTSFLILLILGAIVLSLWLTYQPFSQDNSNKED